MSPAMRKVRNFLVSLKLTVWLLAIGVLLVFAATWAQTELGIWAVQEEFFRSFIAFWKVGPLYIPLPGGYLVGGLLTINLIAAQIYRFKFTWKKTGIILIHIGLLVLLFGEFFTGIWQEDYSMRLEEGQSRNYVESFRRNELIVTETTDPNFDDVVAIPEEHLASGKSIQHPKLPFTVAVRDYYPNANLGFRTAAGRPSPATRGIGERIEAVEAPLTYKQDDRNLPAAYVELVAPGGSLGTWLLSAHPQIVPQTFEHQGRTWKIGLRLHREYHPFTVSLLDFRHDVYTGTDIPKNFSSRVRVNTPDGRDDHEALIYMNNPLRYEGLTFYQASFEQGRNDVTVLQVVHNPSRHLPYIACILMSAGLLYQFLAHLIAFIAERRSQAIAATASKQPAA